MILRHAVGHKISGYILCTPFAQLFIVGRIAYIAGICGDGDVGTGCGNVVVT